MRRSLTVALVAILVQATALTTASPAAAVVTGTYSAGDQLLTVYGESGGFNLDFLRLTA